MTQPTSSREHLFKSIVHFSRKRQFAKRNNLSKCFDYRDLQFYYFIIWPLLWFDFRLFTAQKIV